MDTSIIRKLTASDGMVITDTTTETLRASAIYLGIEDDGINYKEIPEDTPLPDDGEATIDDLYNALAKLGVE